jgi:hypothetical protein
LPANDTYPAAWPWDPAAATSRTPGNNVIMAARLRFTIGSCATSVCRIVADDRDCVVSTSGIEA